MASSGAPRRATPGATRRRVKTPRAVGFLTPRLQVLTHKRCPKWWRSRSAVPPQSTSTAMRPRIGNCGGTNAADASFRPDVYIADAQRDDSAFHGQANPDSNGTRLPTGNDGSRCKADDEGIAPQRKGIYEKDAPCEETLVPDWPRGETTPTSVRAPRQVSAKHHPH